LFLGVFKVADKDKDYTKYSTHNLSYKNQHEKLDVLKHLRFTLLNQHSNGHSWVKVAATQLAKKTYIYEVNNSCCNWIQLIDLSFFNNAHVDGENVDCSSDSLIQHNIPFVLVPI
jgi:hypothetical protein